MFVVKLCEFVFSQNWVAPGRVALRERLRACRVRYGVDGMIMEFKISV